ncbi:NAD-dependent epimerase/dehydratase family protein [Caldalkalibacillus salinus]|uniref:NAD-dependent epimerase/dehydratase family protein n=1 Tax=Caldalkalibacillus salinus TaxID=2803787 RepID=UPI00192394DC|nr:NAD(P)-dependent oxidoreductase [Caldalkalibacillus salinus]
MKQKVVLIGGSGTVGQVLREGLQDQFHMITMDKNIKGISGDAVMVDAMNPSDLITKIPDDASVLVNLLAIKTSSDIQDQDKFHQMTDIFFKASYNILLAATQKHIPKVIFASSNHVTDVYEEKGHSLLDREITVSDYPYSKGLYGVLKLASENLGYIFAHQKNLSVINIRIGSVPPDEQKALQQDERLHRTLLTREDTVQLFNLAIRSQRTYGTYYGVSDNAGKPWSIKETTEALGYVSQSNAQHKLKHQP